jgi:hypothetical protein
MTEDPAPLVAERCRTVVHMKFAAAVAATPQFALTGSSASERSVFALLAMALRFLPRPLVALRVRESYSIERESTESWEKTQSANSTDSEP